MTFPSDDNLNDDNLKDDTTPDDRDGGPRRRPGRTPIQPTEDQEPYLAAVEEAQRRLDEARGPYERAIAERADQVRRAGAAGVPIVLLGRAMGTTSRMAGRVLNADEMAFLDSVEEALIGRAGEWLTPREVADLVDGCDDHVPVAAALVLLADVGRVEIEAWGDDPVGPVYRVSSPNQER